MLPNHNHEAQIVGSSVDKWVGQTQDHEEEEIVQDRGEIG